MLAMAIKCKKAQKDFLTGCGCANKIQNTKNDTFSNTLNRTISS